jgi:general stress protein 26
MQTPSPLAPPPAELLERVIEILRRHRLMTVATLRADGWPQATIVNYAADGLRLYFVVSTLSQKLANIRRDHRVSIAVGGSVEGPPLGLSLAARVSEVDDLGQISAINDRLWSEKAGTGFSPHPSTPGSVLLAADPVVLSLIDYDGPKAWPRLFRVEPDWRLAPLDKIHPDTPEAGS